MTMRVRSRGTRAVVALMAGLSGEAAGQWTNGSQDVLPLAATNGRTMDVAAGDFDGDGALDLAIATEFGQNVIFLWRNGRFEYAQDALPQGTRHDSEDIAVGDFDQDGDLDLLFVSEDDQTNEYLLNDGGGVFTREPLPTAGAGGITNGVAFGDVDGDGDLDAVLGNSGPQTAPGQPNATGGQNVLLINDGDGFFEHAEDALPEINDRTQDIALGDLDGDGDLDMVVANEDANRILRNDGSGVFEDMTSEWLGTRATEETREVALGDVDGDGDLDVYFANVAWSGVSPRDALFLNDGSGKFTDGTARLPARDVFSLDAVLVDVDADGDLDVVLAQIAPPAGPAVSVLLNENGRFSEAADFLPPDATGHGICVEVQDFDNDGQIDIYIGNHMSSDLLLVG